MGMDWINPIQSNPRTGLDWGQFRMEWIGLDWDFGKINGFEKFGF